MGQYIRYAIVPLDEVVNKITSSQGAEHKTKAHLSSGHVVGITSLRMKTFGRAASSKKGIHCKACGIMATHFAVEGFRNSVFPSIHANLYGIKDDKEILFTQDHVIPKSRGGADNLNNSQVMCQPCNSSKGSKSDRKFKAEKRGERKCS